MTAVRTTGTAVSAALAATGALHAVWARSPWPLRTRAEFADAVVGVEERRAPSPAACVAVAGLLGAGAYLVGARAGALPAAGPRWLRRAGAGTVAGVLLARGSAGPVLFTSGRVERSERFLRLDRRYYSPLCLVLGAGSAVVAVAGE
jgi:hypothetical protein